MSDLDTKISIQPFQQILALSQKAINDSFFNLYQSNPAKWSKFANVKVHKSSIRNATLDYPRVMLNPTPSNNGQAVIYVVVFKSGTCTLDTDPSNPADKTMKPWVADMTGWRIGLPVTITQQPLSPTDPSHVANAQYAGVAATNYTTQQLIADLSAADFADLKNTTFQTFGATNGDGSYVNGWNTLSDLVQNQWAALLNQWIVNEATADLTILGKSLTPNNAATGAAATFQPTSLRYQTYPYMSSDGTWQPPSLDGNGTLNTLLYLQNITGTLPTAPYLPTDAQGRGIWFSNPEDPEPSHYGSFAISPDFWWVKTILPKLRSFNAALEGRIDNTELGVNCSYDASNLHTTASFQPHYSCGTNFDTASNNSAYDFVPSADGLSYGWASVFTTNRNCNWAQDSSQNNAPGDRQSDEAWGGTQGKTSAELTTRNFHKLTITPGSNIIKLSGTNEVYLYWDFTAVITPFTAITRYVATWSADITLGDVTDGGLQITCENRQYNVAQPNYDDKLDNVNQEIKDLMQQGINQLNTFENQIQNAVQGLEKFVFPGQGVFFFKKPRVGYQKNLVVDLGYNGIFGPPNVNAPQARAAPSPIYSYTPGSTTGAMSSNS